jgi:MoCo/4Fe-4S cofactor protein with predicted Tat translocation signal
MPRDIRNEQPDLAALRSRLAGAQGKHYWRSLAELAESPEFHTYLRREFPSGAQQWRDPLSRRTFKEASQHLYESLGSVNSASISSPIALRWPR